MKKIFIIIAFMLSVPSFATVYYVTDGFFGSKTITGTDTLIMTGGGGESLTCRDFSQTQIQNTSPLAILSGGLWTIDIFGWSQLNISGGQINHIDIGQNATAVLSGGQINEIISGYSSTQPNPNHIKVICKTATYNPTTKYLYGVWNDNSVFNIKFLDRFGYSSVISNVTIIPEPTTLLLLLAGGVLIRKK